MRIGKIIGCLGAGALCVVTGGLAAPAIGAAVGATMGLSGAAATAAGLATLGGGSLAAGGLGMAGDTALIQAVAGGVGVIGAGIASNAAEGAELKEQNRKLREELENANLDNATKQCIIEQLNAKVEKVTLLLKEERAKTQRNQEKIRCLEEQLDDLLATLRAAQAA